MRAEAPVRLPPPARRRLSRVAVIGTFHRRPQNIPAIADALIQQTRRPDLVFLLWDDPGDSDALDAAEIDLCLEGIRAYSVRVVPEPGVIPYSRKINDALDAVRAWRGEDDYVLYLTDDSLPAPRKIELMAAALDEHPEWGQVYCGQDRDGGIHNPGTVIQDPYCVLDHTQVMHRYTEDRWPLELDKIRLGDAHFWNALRARQGPFYPVPEVLDATRRTPDGITATA